jgi:hypothetical protein
MDEERKDRISNLNETLYSRTRYRNPLDKRTPIKESEPQDVVDKWQTPELDEMLKYERIPPRVNPLMKKVFTFAFLFFIAAILIAGYVFTGGATFISSKNVDINILGPSIISAGEVLELGVSVSNTNNADLEVANLSIQYPQGSRNPLNNAESLTYTRDDLGVVEAGTEAVSNMRAVLLGATGEVKEIKFSVEYKVKGSNATFYKDKIFEVTIGDAPITLVIDSPASVTSGNSFTTTVSVTLNSTDILKNVVLKAEYPYGFSVLDTIPQALAENNIWALGDLSPGSKRTISIRGQLIGENNEERTFRFYVGVSDANNINPSPKIIITSFLNTVAIERPSIALDVTFNGENVPVYIAPAARSISTSIKFRNNLPDRLLNPRLDVSLSGAALDKFSVIASNNGIYDSGSGKISWNLADPLGGSELAPGEDGQVSLNFSSLPSSSLSGEANDIKLNLSITAVPVGRVGQMPVTISETRKVTISSLVNFSSKVLRTLGPFANYGPIPPKVGEETSYTVVLNVGNTRGDLADTIATLRLGQGVVWLGAQSFTSENVSYDAPSNTITWDLTTLSSGTGFSSAPREISFQVALTPTIGQVGIAPVLISDILLTGRDSVTGGAVTASTPSLTTRLLEDPAFIQGDDVVIK